jgi:hypothetical protein
MNFVTFVVKIPLLSELCVLRASAVNISSFMNFVTFVVKIPLLSELCVLCASAVNISSFVTSFVVKNPSSLASVVKCIPDSG